MLILEENFRWHLKAFKLLHLNSSYIFISFLFFNISVIRIR